MTRFEAVPYNVTTLLVFAGISEQKVLPRNLLTWNYVIVFLKFLFLAVYSLVTYLSESFEKDA